MTTIHLVRHGESEWNVLGLVQGQTHDVPLTERGQQQAEDAARAISTLGPTHLVTSDLVRAAQTAVAIEAATGVVARRESRLRERSYGEDEGRRRLDVPALGHPALVSPGGESFADVVTRVRAWLDDVRRVTVADDVVVAVTHGDVISAVLTCLDGPAPRAHHDNGSILTARLEPAPA